LRVVVRKWHSDGNLGDGLLCLSEVFLHLLYCSNEESDGLESKIADGPDLAGLKLIQNLQIHNLTIHHRLEANLRVIEIYSHKGEFLT
jgi:hypothetical protein